MQSNEGDNMDVQEAAAALGVTPGRIRQLIAAGAVRSELLYPELGKGKRTIPRAEVERLKQDRAKENTSGAKRGPRFRE